MGVGGSIMWQAHTLNPHLMGLQGGALEGHLKCPPPFMIPLDTTTAPRTTPPSPLSIPAEQMPLPFHRLCAELYGSGPQEGSLYCWLRVKQ